MEVIDGERLPGAGARRRAKLGLLTAVLVTALTVVGALAVVLGATARWRLDVTAAREHSLSPRTEAIVARLEGTHHVVVSANLGAINPVVRQRVADVLAAFAESGVGADGGVRVSTVDTGGAGASAEYAAVIAELASLNADAIEQHAAAITDAEAGLRRAGRALERLGVEWAGHGAGVAGPAIEPRSEIAGIARVLAGETERLADRAGALAESEVAPGVALPEADVLAREVAQLGARVTPIADQAVRVADDASTTGASDIAREARRAAVEARDAVNSAASRLRRLEPLDPLTIARLLREQESVVVFGPAGTTAIRFQAMFPSEADGGTSGADVRFAGEQLIARALGAVGGAAAPTVVLVHAERARVIGDGGSLTAGAAASFGEMARRMTLRRMTLAEWATALDDRPPTLGAADDDERPTVWFVLGPPTGSSGGDAAGATMADRAMRAGRLADAVETLIGRGEAVLMTIGPSTLPSVGEPDPLVEPLQRFGVRCLSGLPLVRRIGTREGPRFAVEHAVRGSGEGEHAIVGALAGLATGVRWATPIELSDPAPDGVTAWPLVSIEDSESVWGESGWLVLGTPQALRRPPTPDPGRDAIGGPWVVAAAAERLATRGPQRLVVVSAAAWFTNDLLTARAEVGGRAVARLPGNAELIDASIDWLAGRDELIATSVTAADVPRIGDVSPGALLAIRWLIVGGLPLLVLAGGVAAWLVRR